jgi:hypothetical protein
VNDQRSMSQRTRRFELRFRALFKQGRSYAFPCDAHGYVDIDALSENSRLNYLFVRAAIGHDYALPVVEPVVVDDAQP